MDAPSERRKNLLKIAARAFVACAAFVYAYVIQQNSMALTAPEASM